MNYQSLFLDRGLEHYADETSKTLVLYVFHQFNDRVQHFIDHALFEAPDVDFVFMCNDPEFDIASHLPEYCTSFNRENKGYDFGAWSDLLLKHGYAQANYDTFLFANSSIKGPFMAKHPGQRWTDVFRDGLTEDIKLFGVTINCAVDRIDPATQTHLQSYLFAMKKPTLENLIEDGLFSETYVATFDEAIRNKEVAMSRMVIKRGGNIGSTLSYYKGIDWRSNNLQFSEYNVLFRGDVMYPQFMYQLWTPDELVFVKGNRVTI